MITNDQIRELYANGLISGTDAWDALNNEHTDDGRAARARIANVLAGILDPEEINIVSMEACS